MTDELRLEGIDVAPGVLDTIVTLAAGAVDGVASVQSGGIGGLVKGSSAKGPMVSVGEAGVLSACVHVSLEYGRPLHETATKVQQAVADALTSQTGQPVSGVDVYVDGVVFDG